MAAGCDIAAGPRIDFHDLARGKDLLLLQHDDAGAVAALLVGPDPRRNVLDRVGEVLGAVIADLAVRTLRGVAADRHGRIHQQVEPIGRLLDLRASLGKDRAVVFSAGENPACGVGEPRQRRARRRLAEVEGLVGEKILAADFRRDVAFADIGAARSRQAFGVSAGRQHAVEIHVGERGDQIADAGRADRQAVDLLEAARSVRIKTLSRLLGRRARCRCILPPMAGRPPAVPCRETDTGRPRAGFQSQRPACLAGCVCSFRNTPLPSRYPSGGP